jgi:hypothetical protein
VPMARGPPAAPSSSAWRGAQTHLPPAHAELLGVRT